MIPKGIEYYLEQDYDFFSIGCIPLACSKTLRHSFLATCMFEIIEGQFTTTLCYAMKRTTVECIQSDMQKYLTQYDIDYYFWMKTRACGYVLPIFKQNFTDSDNFWFKNRHLENWSRVYAKECFSGQLSFPQKLCTWYYYMLYVYTQTKNLLWKVKIDLNVFKNYNKLFNSSGSNVAVYPRK